MGSRNGKPASGNTESSPRICAVSSDPAAQTSSWGQSFSSVRRTVNDLYEDGKHAFSFSPIDNNNLNSKHSGKVEDTFNKRELCGKTPLTLLIDDKNVNDARELLLNPGVDVNYPEGQLYCGYRWDYYPPLIVAIQTEYIPMVRLLLLSGASVNLKDSQGYSVLYHAARLGNREMMALLLSYWPDLTPPPQDFDRYTITDPLHIACCNGHTDVAELLIKAGYPVNPTEDNGSSPLDGALDSGDEALCLLLLKHGARVTEHLFFKACRYGCGQVVQTMINLGTNVRAVTEFGETALMLALNPGASNRLRRKLAYRTDVFNVRDEAYEILQRDINVINLLCENGCDLEALSRSEAGTVLHQSWKLQNMPAFIVLLKHGAIFELCNRNLNIEYVNDDIFDELSELYVTFVDSHIPEEVIRKRNHQHLERTKGLTSLQHLCRLTIRRTLKFCRKGSHSIIISIKDLGLPIRLKDYLCYSEINEMDSGYCNRLFRLSVPGLT